MAKEIRAVWDNSNSWALHVLQNRLNAWKERVCFGSIARSISLEQNWRHSCIQYRHRSSERYVHKQALQAFSSACQEYLMKQSAGLEWTCCSREETVETVTASVTPTAAGDDNSGSISSKKGYFSIYKCNWTYGYLN